MKFGLNDLEALRLNYKKKIHQTPEKMVDMQTKYIKSEYGFELNLTFNIYQACLQFCHLWNVYTCISCSRPRLRYKMSNWRSQQPKRQLHNGRLFATKQLITFYRVYLNACLICVYPVYQINSPSRDNRTSCNQRKCQRCEI